MVQTHGWSVKSLNESSNEYINGHISIHICFIFLLIFTALFMVLILSPSDACAIHVTQDITIDTTWQAFGNPWSIGSDIDVLHGATLTLMPGVAVSFEGRYTISCEGTGKIIANGKTDNPIVITSNSPSLFRYGSVWTGRGGIFNNCTFTYGDRCLSASTDSKIADCFFSFSNDGLYISGADVEIERCTVTRCNTGINLVDSARAHLLHSEVSNCDRGIWLYGLTSYTIIEQNKVSSCNHSGIRVETSGDGNLLVKNYVSNTRCGILMTGSRDVLVYGTVVMDCQTGYFLHHTLTTRTTPILLERCRIQNCGRGIDLYQAEWIYVNETRFEKNDVGIIHETTPISDITFWRNNFLWNTMNALQTLLQVNWSLGSTGNYWSDYTGTDADGDGIGDTPYDVTPTQQDPYPLMRPVDFEDPSPEAGANVTVRQHSAFKLDGRASTDDTWITNWTWTVNVPGAPLTLYGPEASGVVDVAGAFEVVLRVTDAVDKTATDRLTLFVTDGDPPTFLSIDVPEVVGTGSALNISCRVHDNVAVVAVTVDYYYGSGGIRLGDLASVGGEAWWLEVPVPSDSVEPVYYIITARDARNNRNSTGYLSVQVVDDDPPVLVPALPTHVTTGDEATIRCTAFDNIALRGVTAEYRFNGTSPVTVNLTGSAHTWSATVTVPPDALSPMSVLLTATDVSDHHVTAGPLDLRVDDNDPPTMEGNWTTPPIGAWRKGTDVMIEMAVEDNIGVVTALVERRYAGTDWEAIPMSLEGDRYSATVDIATDLGDRLWYRFNATDGAGTSLVTPATEVRLLSLHPVITTAPDTRVLEDHLYNLTFRAVDADTDLSLLRWSMVTNATWLHLDAVTGVLSGVPGAGDIGSYAVNVTVVDGAGGRDWMLFDIEVIDVNHPPVVMIDAPANGARAGSVLTIVGRATDDEGRLVWVKLQVDDGAWIQVDGTTEWSHELDTRGLRAGNHTITVVASDGVTQSEKRTVVFVIHGEGDGGWQPGMTHALVAIIAVAVLLVWIIVRRAQRKGGKGQLADPSDVEGAGAGI